MHVSNVCDCYAHNTLNDCAYMACFQTECYACLCILNLRQPYDALDDVHLILDVLVRHPK